MKFVQDIYALLVFALMAFAACVFWNKAIVPEYPSRQPALLIDGVAVYVALIVSMLYLEKSK